MAKTEKQKMLGGELYTAKDSELAAESLKAQRLLARYNASWSEQGPEEPAGPLPRKP